MEYNHLYHQQAPKSKYDCLLFADSLYQDNIAFVQGVAEYITSPDDVGPSQDEETSSTISIPSARLPLVLQGEGLIWNSFTHVSYCYGTHQEKPNLKTQGGIHTLTTIWKDLPNAIKREVDRAGFSQFMDAVGSFDRKTAITHLLVQRWWESTHTFHLPSGEWTMTPMDFACITGLPMQGDPLPIDYSYRGKTRMIEKLMGYTPTRLKDYSFRISALVSRLVDQMGQMQLVPEGSVAARQYARVFLLYMLGMTLFAGSNVGVPIYLLSCLVKFEKISSYDWGSAGLLELYGNMDQLCRSATKSVCGFSLVWQIWAYEIWGLNHFTLREDMPDTPRMKRWVTSNRLYRPYSLKEDKVNRALNETQLLKGCPYPWATFEHIYPTALRKTRSRLLLQGVGQPLFFLGERVSRQHGVGMPPLIPAPLPYSVLFPNQADQACYTGNGMPSTTLVEFGDYEAFCREDLYGPLVCPMLDYQIKRVIFPTKDRIIDDGNESNPEDHESAEEEVNQLPLPALPLQFPTCSTSQNTHVSSVHRFIDHDVGGPTSPGLAQPSIVETIAGRHDISVRRQKRTYTPSNTSSDAVDYRIYQGHATCSRYYPWTTGDLTVVYSQIPTSAPYDSCPPEYDFVSREMFNELSLTTHDYAQALGQYRSVSSQVLCATGSTLGGISFAGEDGRGGGTGPLCPASLRKPDESRRSNSYSSTRLGTAGSRTRQSNSVESKASHHHEP